MFTYKERQARCGYDCWGMTNWVTVYDFYRDGEYMFTVFEDAESILERLNKPNKQGIQSGTQEN